MNRSRNDSRAVSVPSGVEVVARYRDIVPDWSAFLEALQRPLPQCLWSNTLRSNGEELYGLLMEVGMEPQRLAWREDAFRIARRSNLSQQWWYLIGLAHSQEEVSQLPVQLLDVQPGMRVWDMCAAPGGKSAQIAVALKNSGTVLANDISTGRLRALSGNLERLGLLNIVTSRYDAATFPQKAGLFDRVLLDAPCSGEGTLRKNATHTERMGEMFSRQLSGIQKVLLRKAIQHCKPGGRIVYSTCTFAPEENELVVAAILEEFAGDVTLLSARMANLNSSPGVTAWQGQRLDAVLSHCLRIWPQQNDSGGFFVAVLQKSISAGGADYTAAELEVDDTTDWRGVLSERFGFADEAWSGFQAHRQSQRGLHLASADLLPPVLPKVETQGGLFYRTTSRPPKMTTAAALLLGGYAERNRIELSAEQRDGYLQRGTFELDECQRNALTPGFVLVFYRQHCLGLGRFHAKSQTLESQFPRKWGGRAELPS